MEGHKVVSDSGFEVDFFADFDSEMGNGKSSELITGDNQDMDNNSQSISGMDGSSQPGDHGELCEQVLTSDVVDVHGYSVDGGGGGDQLGVGVLNNDVTKTGNNLDNISSDSLGNVESMDTSDLIQVPEETANMMMADEDFSDLVSHQVVTSLGTIQGSSGQNLETVSHSQPEVQLDSNLNLAEDNSVGISNLIESANSLPVASNSVSIAKLPQTGGRTIVMATSGASVQSVVASIAKSQQQSGQSSQAPIIIPVSSSILSSPTALSEFINSIKPPVIPGSATLVKTSTSSPQIINLASSSAQQFQLSPSSGTLRPIKMTTYSKKQPTNIAPAPLASTTMSMSSLQSAINAGSFKVINTPSGQQLLVSSPIKQEGGGSKVVNIPVSSGTSSGGQVVYLSSSTKQSGTATIRPGSGLKTLAPAPVRVSLAPSTSGALGQRPAVKQSSVQVVKVVQGTTGSGKATLRPLAPNTSGAKTIQLTSAQLASLISGSGEFSGGKLTVIPASSSSSATSGGQKITTITASGQKIASTGGGQMIQIGNQQILLPSSSSTSTTSQPQVIMLPAQLLQGLAGNGTFTIQTGGMGKQMVVKPASAVTATPSRGTTNYVPIAPSPNTSSNIHPSTKDVLNKLTPTSKDIINQNGKHPLNLLAANEEPNRQRKPCNCTKSGCLKLYCDCFAQGEFCNACNCVNCNNNLDHEEERQKAVKQCLDRNPEAFRPKIGKGRMAGDIAERRHTKGCNCRRSGCLKNYCECYEAKILCSELCKCDGCKNFEDSFERKTLQLMNLAEAAEYRSSQANVSKLINWGNDFNTKLPVSIASISERIHHPVNFITNDIVDSTTACLMAVAADGEKRKLDQVTIEANLLNEFGRCLNKIIEWSERSSENSLSNHVIVGKHK